jgi:hypothetical protein
MNQISISSGQCADVCANVLMLGMTVSENIVRQRRERTWNGIEFLMNPSAIMFHKGQRKDDVLLSSNVGPKHTGSPQNRPEPPQCRASATNTLSNKEILAKLSHLHQGLATHLYKYLSFLSAHPKSLPLSKNSPVILSLLSVAEQ